MSTFDGRTQKEFDDLLAETRRVQALPPKHLRRQPTTHNATGYTAPVAMNTPPTTPIDYDALNREWAEYSAKLKREKRIAEIEAKFNMSGISTTGDWNEYVALCEGVQIFGEIEEPETEPADRRYANPGVGAPETIG